jgi:DTW domain-containing protein YfiP
VPVKLIILQHPLENKHAKNTARLINLCIPETRIVVGETAQDFATLRSELCHAQTKTWVIYPNQHSKPLHLAAKTSATTLPETLILIDATWRKAYKMWQLNPWLDEFPSWHFNAQASANYRVRKSSLPHSLSTLEATSLALQTLFASDTQGLTLIFETMQQNIERFAPPKN